MWEWRERRGHLYFFADLRPCLMSLTLLTFCSGCICVDRREFCQFDKFEANCEDDEVVIIGSAQYGRMRAGRCISGEGYIGCSADVRVYLDGRCSGRRQCAVDVASLTDIVQPCRRDFTSYMEASYTCMKGQGESKSQITHAL